MNCHNQYHLIERTKIHVYLIILRKWEKKVTVFASIFATVKKRLIFAPIIINIKIYSS